jgi:hypothetical protein
MGNKDNQMKERKTPKKTPKKTPENRLALESPIRLSSLTFLPILSLGSRQVRPHSNSCSTTRYNTEMGNKDNQMKERKTPKKTPKKTPEKTLVEPQGGIWVEKVSILIIKASRVPTLY